MLNDFHIQFRDLRHAQWKVLMEVFLIDLAVSQRRLLADRQAQAPQALRLRSGPAHH